MKQLNSFVDFTLEVDLTDTTEILMEKIELHTGMPPEKQMLRCQGKDLEKGCTLKDQNIKFGSAIKLNFLKARCKWSYFYFFFLQKRNVL